MSYNGSGVFNINTAGQPVVTGTVISSTAFNALTSDLGTGLSTAITKDGQTTATARIPFAQGINSSLVTDATSTTTGSIITAGGVGIAKSLYVGTGISGALNGTVGATTPSTGAFTTLSASSTVSAAGSTTIDSSGNLGVGATAPSTWGALAVRKAVAVLGRSVSGSFSDASTGTMEIAHAAGYVALDTESGSVALRIAQGGTVNGQFNQYGLGIGSGVPSSGMGITFPATQSASTDANTLDDYEEGTWTPSLKFGGASVGMAGTFEGYYTKIGRLVSGQGRMILSAKGSSTGAATLALPFTSAATNTLPGMSVGYYESWASSITASCYINSGSALLQLTNLTGTTVGALSDTNFTNATRCDFSFSYIV